MDELASLDAFFTLDRKSLLSPNSCGLSSYLRNFVVEYVVNRADDRTQKPPTKTFLDPRVDRTDDPTAALIDVDDAEDPAEDIPSNDRSNAEFMTCGGTNPMYTSRRWRRDKNGCRRRLMGGARSFY